MQLSKINGITNATTVDLDFQGIMELILTHGYSPSTFHNGHRCLDNFEQTNLIILDVDENLSVAEAKKRLAGYKFILATTRNHQREKTLKSGKVKPACDRFRIVLFLEGKITNKNDYKHTCRVLLGLFPELDPSCSEASRFFYASKKIIEYSEHGKLIDIEVAPEQVVTREKNNGKLGNLSAKTKDFLAHGAEVGTWNNRLYLAALDLNEQNYTREVALAMLNSIEEPLDDSDMSTFDSAFDREPKYAPRETNVLTIKGFDTPEPAKVLTKEYEGLTIPFYASNLRCWLDELFEVNTIRINEKDDITVNDRKVQFDFFRNLIYLSTGEAKRYKLDSKGEKVVNKFKQPIVIATAVAHRGVVDSYINKWMDEERQRIVAETKLKIKFVGNNVELDKYVNTITTNNVELTVAVLRQFIYNVKLKLHRRHPKFIIMPVFVGIQGVGKSLAIEKLLQPIKHMSAPVNFDIFKDSREFKGTFGEKLVLEFDEMSSAKKADIEAVKNKITAERINYRVLGTTQNTTMFNMSSCIGSSNSTLIDLLYDDTGKRRFFEVVCKKQTFWDSIDSIDPLLIWQSVDISQPPPILDFLPALNEAQDGYKNLNSVEEFLVDENLIPKKEEKTFKIPREELYKQYADCMALQKRSPYSRTNFYKKCRMVLTEEIGASRKGYFLLKEVE